MKYEETRTNNSNIAKKIYHELMNYDVQKIGICVDEDYTQDRLLYTIYWLPNNINEYRHIKNIVEHIVTSKDEIINEMADSSQKAQADLRSDINSILVHVAKIAIYHNILDCIEYWEKEIAGFMCNIINRKITYGTGKLPKKDVYNVFDGEMGNEREDWTRAIQKLYSDNIEKEVLPIVEPHINAVDEYEEINKELKKYLVNNVQSKVRFDTDSVKEVVIAIVNRVINKNGNDGIIITNKKK